MWCPFEEGNIFSANIRIQIRIDGWTLFVLCKIVAQFMAMYFVGEEEQEIQFCSEAKRRISIIGWTNKRKNIFNVFRPWVAFYYAFKWKTLNWYCLFNMWASHARICNTWVTISQYCQCHLSQLSFICFRCTFVLLFLTEENM